MTIVLNVFFSHIKKRFITNLYC